jgi:hydroxyacylglutathione hydrolase
VARPDLAIEKAEGARGIFRSLQGQLLSLGGDVEVWPGHLGGSMCGGPGMDMKVSSTVGFERRHNPVLAIEHEDEFVDRALAGLGPQPPNFRAIVALNRGPLLTDGVELLPLAPRQVEQARVGGAMLVDVRTDQQFDDAHIPGAVSIPMLNAGFGSKLAWLADRDQPIVFVGRDDEDGRRAGSLAVAVGIRRLAGFLGGGMTSWRQEKRAVERIERLPLADLPERAGEVQILDVRERSEWDEGHIPGSTFTPWHDIEDLPDGVDPDRPIAVVCASGQRAAVAASLVQRFGAAHVIHVIDGGVPAWGELGRPLER